MKISHRNISFLLFLLIALTSCSQETETANRVFISGGKYFDPHSKTLVDNPGIYIEDGIVVDPFDTTTQTTSLHKITLTDTATILPGLIDLHGHYRVEWQGEVWDDTVAFPKIFLANGVTSTFPAGEIQPEKMKHLSRAIDKGNRPGARILHSGPYYGSAAPDWNRDISEAELRQLVNAWADSGVYGFKAKNITSENLQILIDEAHKRGLSVTAHLNSGVGNSVNPQEALEMGIDRVEHFLGGRLLADTANAYASLQYVDPTDSLLQEIIELYIKHGTYFDATLGTYGSIGQTEGPVFEDWANEYQYMAPKMVEDISKNQKSDFARMSQRIYPVKAAILKRYYEAGGKITVGSDRPLLVKNYLGIGLGGFFIHREMHAMVVAGIPAEEVLFFATLQNATALGIEDSAGSLEPGKWADVVIIKGNPLEDITNTRKVAIVIRNGKIYNPNELLKSVIGRLGTK